MKNVQHSSSGTNTTVTFSTSYTNNCYGVVLSNPPNAVAYGCVKPNSMTVSGYILQTGKSSSASGVQIDYYSLAIGY